MRGEQGREANREGAGAGGRGERPGGALVERVEEALLEELEG